MAKQLETVLDVGHVFRPGTQVEAHPRVSDVFAGVPITKAASKAKVSANGSVTFKGLLPGGPYLVHGTVKLSVPHPTRVGATEDTEEPRNLNFTAAQPLDDEQAVRNTQASAALVARREADARAAIVADAPAGAGVGGSGREMISGAVNTANSRPQENPPTSEQVGAESRPGESRETAAADGVEDRPAEARRGPSFRSRPTRPKPAKPRTAKLRSKPSSRKAGKPASAGRPSR